jgi:imidazolonepropionase-like amidohydrolase
MAAALFVACGRGEPALVIRDVTVIDGTGAAPLPAVTVVVRGERIAAIGEDVDYPGGSEVIDGRRKYLIPGLWDLHFHLAGLDPHPNALETLVSFGVTGVRDMGGDLDTLIRRREEVEAGVRIGPKIVMAGYTLQGDQYADFHRAVRTEEEGRTAVAEMGARGVDFIKVHNMLKPEVFFAIVEEASARGLAVAGHVPRGVSPLEASEAGMKSFEHAEALLEAEIFRRDDPAGDIITALSRLTGPAASELFATLAENGTAFTPTLSGYEAFVASQEEETVRARGEGLFRRLVAMTGEMHAAGVTILAGTDTRSAPGAALHRELALLVEAGLTPLEALRAATSIPASFLGLDDNLGTIAVGKLANLVLLEANPLDRIENTSRVSAVILKGTYLDPGAIFPAVADPSR